MIIDDYKKGWAFRYLREAKVDLITAEKSPVPLMAVSIAVLAMKKAQAAIYYSLGDPIYLEPMIRYIADKGKPTHDHLLRCLVRFERIIHARSETPESLTKERALEEARHLIDIAKDIVESVTGERAEA